MKAIMSAAAAQLENDSLDKHSTQTLTKEQEKNGDIKTLIPDHWQK